MRVILIKTLLSLCFTFLSVYHVLAQENLEAILWSSNDFGTIVKQGETYFRKKHPTIPFKKLTEGKYRDGEFVKFMRWRSFWKESLNEDGTLGDVAAYNINQLRRKSQNNSLYKEVTWTNLSHQNYITTQIGLGRTTSMGFHPTNPAIFYVGAAIGGIWKTIDGGQTYTPLGDDLPFMAVSSIIVDQDNPETIYIAISDHVWYGPPSIGVYKSTDGGLTWSPTALSFSFAQNIRIYWMEADPTNTAKMFVATARGLYLTEDGFETIQLINTANTFDVKINTGNPDIIYQGRGDGSLYRSTNGGQSFDFIKDFGSGNIYIALSNNDSNKVYVRNRTTLYQSTDGGLTFNTSFTLPENNSVFTFAPNNDNILLSGNFETHRSDNNGESFIKTSDWLGRNGLPLIHVDQRNMFINPLENDYVYYCNDGGVYRYVVSTNTFENLSNGLMITQFYDIAVSQSNAAIIGGGSQDNGNIYRKTDGTWDDYAGTGDGMNQEIDPTDENVRYWSYQNGSLRRWISGSNSDIVPPMQTGAAWETPYKLDPRQSNRIIAGYDAVYESLDRGENWTDISGKIFGGALNELAIAPSNPNRIYVTRGSNLYVKEINSNTWVNKSLPAEVSDIEVDFEDMDVVYISVPGYTSNSKVYKSTDAGTTWENISGTLPNTSVGALELYENIAGGVFVGTDIGVYYLDNELLDWQEYGELPHTRVEDIEIQYAAQLIRVGTHGRGVLEAPIVITTCDENDKDTDKDGICDTNDVCPDLDNNLIGTACDDGNPLTSGEVYTVDCNCSGGGSNIAYCEAEGANGTGADWIKRIHLNTLDYSSQQTNYSDFRNESTSLTIGDTYILTMDLNYSFEPDKAHAWIDYNQNGIFETTEAINMSVFINHTSTGEITIPSDLEPLVTTMRVRVIYNGQDSPCGSYYGEVEDYTVFIEANVEDLCEDFRNEPLNLDTDPVVDETIKTKETITSSVNIIEGLNVTYQAGASITLTDGFYVENGASFHAFIEDCGTTSVNENKVLTTRTSTAIEHFHKKAISNTLAVKVYPNPFSNSTAIEYILSEASPVVVKIIDLTGQTVATLVNSTIQQAGEYQLTWQNEAAISGTLLLYIQNNTEVIVEKMVVIK